MCLAYPALVVSIEDGAAVVEAAERRQRIITICLEGDLPVPGEWLLVQSGLALAKLSEQERNELSR